MRRIHIIGALMLSVTTTTRAEAASPSAAAARRLAFERLAAKDYKGGIEALRAAHGDEPHPEDTYNIAVAYEKWGGHCVDALTHYRAYVEGCPECSRVNAAREKSLLLASLCDGAADKRSQRADSPPQQVEGWAEIRGDDLVTARQAAIADGLKQAVEMVAGVEIVARFEDATSSKLDGDREQFQLQVESTIRTRTEGFVRKFEVLSDRREGRILRVDLVVEVDAARVRSQIDQIADRIARARYPRLVVAVSEHYRDREGTSHETRHLETLLKRMFTEKGFEVIDAVDTTAEGVAAAGADYIVEATVVVRHTGFNRRGAGEYYGEAELGLKLVDLSSGAIVAEEARAGHSPNSIFSEARLSELTVGHVAGDLAEVVVGRLLDSWVKAEKAGIRYRLELHGMKNYEVEGRAFIATVKSTLAVSMVTERSQRGDALVLELRYPAGADLSTLRDGILRGLKGKREFQKLTSEARGRTLTFRTGR